MKKDIVYYCARFTRKNYQEMKRKAKIADISFNKFINRAILVCLK